MRHLKSLLLICLSILLAGCSILPKEEVRRKAPLLVETETEEFEMSYVTRGDLELTERVSCTYVPIQKFNLSFGVSGEFIDEMYVETGEIVKKGQVLGQLNMDGVEESINELTHNINTVILSMEHNEEDRAIAIERQKILFAADPEKMQEAIDSVNESFDNTKQNYENTLYLYEMQLESVYETKRKRQLISPIDGTVTYARKYTESSVSDETERAATVVDSTMSLFSASTDKWHLFKPGDEYVITCKKTDYEAVVIDPDEYGIDVGNRIEGKRANVYLTLVTPSLELEDNDKGTLTLILDARYDVLIVHEDAISSANGEAIAYVLDENGMKTYKKVKVGLEAGKYIEVIEGLEEGEEVIVG